MVTFLIFSNNQAVRETHAMQLIRKQSIHQLDISFLETQGSIGIEDIRNFQKQILLKPIKGTTKAAIIKNAHMLTIEAQNALLKTLEEPPANTYIFLTAETNNTLLSTILSRTSIITVNKERQFDEQEIQEIEKELQQIFSDTIGYRLKLAEKLAADKALAIAWLERAIIVLRKTMLEKLDIANSYLTILASLQETHRILKTTNVTARLSLEILFLNL